MASVKAAGLAGVTVNAGVGPGPVMTPGGTSLIEIALLTALALSVSVGVNKMLNVGIGPGAATGAVKTTVVMPLALVVGVLVDSEPKSTTVPFARMSARNCTFGFGWPF